MRKWIAASIGLALLIGGAAQGQTNKSLYPDRPVRMIVADSPEQAEVPIQTKAGRNRGLSPPPPQIAL